MNEDIPFSSIMYVWYIWIFSMFAKSNLYNLIKEFGVYMFRRLSNTHIVIWCKDNVVSVLYKMCIRDNYKLSYHYSIPSKTITSAINEKSKNSQAWTLWSSLRSVAFCLCKVISNIVNIYKRCSYFVNEICLYVDTNNLKILHHWFRL